MSEMPMYQALLKWSLTQSDGTGPSEAVPMSDERREFLKAALEAHVLDETKRMQDIVTILKYKLSANVQGPAAGDVPAVAAANKGDATTSEDGGAAAVSATPAVPQSDPCTLSYDELVSGAVAARLAQKKKETTFLADSLATVDASRLIEIKAAALRELAERVEQIDNATYFACGAGGSGELPMVMDFIRGGDVKLQFEALSVFKTILQNNPKAQAKALEVGALNALLVPTQTHPEMSMRVKAFSTLSALLRCSSAVPILAFADAGGLEKCVMPALTNKDAPKLQQKALFFLQYAVGAHASFPSKRFAAAGVVRALAVLLASKDDQIVEMSATVVEALLRNAEGLEANAACLKQPELRLEATLQTQLAIIAAKSAEEKEYFEEMDALLKRLLQKIRSI